MLAAEARVAARKQKDLIRERTVDFGGVEERDTAFDRRPDQRDHLALVCGLTVTEVIAEARNTTPEEVGYYRIRPPIKPITLAELSAARDL